MDIKFEVIKKITETNFKIRNIGNISKLDSNSPPSVFVGSKLKYPLVNIGILSPLEKDENAWLYSAERFWAENNFEIKDVVKIRESLLNSRFQSQVNTGAGSRLSKKFAQIAQEIAIAYKPVDMEIKLKKGLSFENQKDRVVTPHGMTARLSEAKITGNVKIHQRVDKIINDDLRASEGISYLYGNGFDEYTLSKILSVGVLGLKTGKKFVPTRWSITATDDTIGKQLIEKIKDYKWIENYELFFGEFLGNQYLILLFPNVWNYELFELYMPKSSWNPSQELKASTDFESFFGRKNYATNTSGGYYAARIPILEYLESKKRQASVLAIRIETPSYWTALGVWVVRESVRKAFNRKMEFLSKEDLTESAKKIAKIKFDFDILDILKRSRMLNSVLAQTKIKDFW
ncbi:MAG TPA: hypothetical protein VJ208_02665 [Candidatus Nanoarchaeia archaeon]|nr:hypothetical protein [Candidatus Nanoarchaeia archaeon]